MKAIQPACIETLPDSAGCMVTKDCIRIVTYVGIHLKLCTSMTDLSDQVSLARLQLVKTCLSAALHSSKHRSHPHLVYLEHDQPEVASRELVRVL